MVKLTAHVEFRDIGMDKLESLLTKLHGHIFHMKVGRLGSKTYTGIVTSITVE